MMEQPPAEFLLPVVAISFTSFFCAHSLFFSRIAHARVRILLSRVFCLHCLHRDAERRDEDAFR